MNNASLQTVFNFLTPQEAARFGSTCTMVRHEVLKNMCVVVIEAILWGEAVPGMTWENQENTKGQKPVYNQLFSSTKTNACKLAEKVRKNKGVFGVKIGYQRDFQDMCWQNFEEYRVNGPWFYEWSI